MSPISMLQSPSFSSKFSKFCFLVCFFCNRYVVGECLVHTDKEAAEEKLQEVTDAINGELKTLGEEVCETW